VHFRYRGSIAILDTRDGIVIVAPISCIAQHYPLNRTSSKIFQLLQIQDGGWIIEKWPILKRLDKSAWKLALKTVQAVKIDFLKSKMPPCCKIQKWHKIWHDNAYWQSASYWQLKFQTFTNPSRRTTTIKNREMATLATIWAIGTIFVTVKHTGHPNRTGS